MNEVKLTDMRQVAYLNMIGVHFKHFERNGKQKIFVYDYSQETIDKHLTEFYQSELTRYMNCLEDIRTLALRG